MPKSKKYPLHLVITLLFVLLILTVGGLIGVLNYIQIRKLLLSAADEIYEKASEQVALNHRVTYNPVRNAIKLLAHSTLADSITVEQRLNHIGVLAAVMYAEKSVSAIQLGYENGGYFVIRKPGADVLKEKFKAPPGTMFVVDNIARYKAATDGSGGGSGGGSGKAYMSRFFYDKTLGLIQKNSLVISQYDSRKDPWYQRATVQPKVLGLRYFDFLKQPGATISMRMYQSKTVVAADMTLENISEGLMKNKVTPHSELYLVTNRNNVVASSNAGEVLTSESNGDVVLKKIEELLPGHMKRILI